MPESMRTLRYLGNDKIAVGMVPRPEPRVDQALVRVEASAVCGSERSALAAGAERNAGHEAAGIVAEAPEGCGFSVGERVGVSAVVGCGRCPECLRGAEVRCATPTVQMGMHADYVAVAPSSLRRLPAGTDAVDAVLLTGDTLGVAARGARRVPVEPGTPVLVIGLGPVGLGAVLVRSFLGAEVVAVEPSAARRELALAAGAKAAVGPGEEIGITPRLVIEASGREDSLLTAIASAAKGATILQAGDLRRAEIAPSTLLAKEITYVGSWYYAIEDYPFMVDLFERGLALRKLATEVVDADDASAGFEHFLAAESGKVVIRWTQ